MAGRSAHPRAGGENPATTGLTIGFTGSSPRGRGKQPREGRAGRVQRLIPARAEKTSTSGSRRKTPQAHPRAGGENSSVCPFFSTAAGSSPRGRGKRADRGGAERRRRLIPARAGKTEYRFGIIAVPAAHPRAGGENHPRRPCSARRSRLIPARAGKTFSTAAFAASIAAHPRTGGENLPCTVMSSADAGSSPRGRGKHSHASALIAAGGLIPARAGKTFARLHAHIPAEAHPRAGGENPSR